MTLWENVAARHRATIGLLAIILVGALWAAATTLLALTGLGWPPDLIAGPRWLWHGRSDAAVVHWVRIGAMAALAMLLLPLGALAKGLPRPLHGAARWAREHEVARAGLRAEHGVILGEKAGRPLISGGADHVMLNAPTRTGKGSGIVVPTLLTWRYALIVLDVKRENWMATAGYRAAHGHRVHMFDPFAEDGATARFNPLGHIPRNEPARVIDELQRIANLLFVASPQGDPFWPEAARTGFIGVGAYVAETAALPFTIGEIYRQLAGEDGDPRTTLLGQIDLRREAGAPLSSACAKALSDFCNSSERTFSSVRQTLTSRLALWLNPHVDAATSASDFDLRTLAGSATSLYLCASPDNLARAAPLYGLLIQQFLDFSTRAPPGPLVDERQVLVVLDEFARLGPAPAIAHAFSFVAGYGIRLLAVLQSPAQLRAVYGPDLADEIRDNCAVEVVFAPRDVEVARKLSDRLGYTGQPSHSQSRPAGLSAGRRSLTESEQRRALMLPQELIGLSQDELIVLKAAWPPIRGRKLRYFDEPTFKARILSPPVVAPRRRPTSDVGAQKGANAEVSSSLGDTSQDPREGRDLGMPRWARSSSDPEHFRREVKKLASQGRLKER